MQSHILFFTDDPEGGGVAEWNHTMLCALADRGYTVTLVQSRVDNLLIRQQAECGVRHVWLDFDTRKDFARTLSNSADAERILHNHAPDLIVFSNGCPLSQFAAKRAAIARGTPYVIVEGLVAGYLVKGFEKSLDELASHYAKAQAVLAVSYENLHLLHRCFRLPVGMGQVIYYGRPARYFATPDPAARRQLREALGIPEDAVLCLTAARLDPIKGYQYQIAAIRRLQQLPVWPRLYFAWAGSGRVESQIAEQVRQLEAGDHVKLLGRRWDVPELMGAADIYIHPSEAEGMPLAVMEAMARGLPVIASAVSGIPEELGPTGKLLPSPRADAATAVAMLAGTVEEWASSAALRSAVGAACRTRALALFREDRMIAQTLQVFEKALLLIGDYVSPGLAIARPDRCFPQMSIASRGHCAWPYLRHHIPHNWYIDPRFPQVGWLDRDEAHLLYHNAAQFRGRRALEIGGFLGWSTCHLALAGVALDALEPMLSQADFRESVVASLQAAGVRDAVQLHAGHSPAAVQDLAERMQRRWSLVFIDGDHEGDAPLRDAQVCAAFAERDAMILLHDLVSPYVARGLDYLRDQGWHTRVYHTAQIMGVAWRGNVQPVPHQPDPRVYWDVPEHLRRYEPFVHGTCRADSTY